MPCIGLSAAAYLSRDQVPAGHHHQKRAPSAHAHPAICGRMGVVQGMKGTRLRLHAMELKARIAQTQPMEPLFILCHASEDNSTDALLSTTEMNALRTARAATVHVGGASSRERLVFHTREFSSVAYGHYGALSCLATFLPPPLRIHIYLRRHASDAPSARQVPVRPAVQNNTVAGLTLWKPSSSDCQAERLNCPGNGIAGSDRARRRWGRRPMQLLPALCRASEVFKVTSASTHSVAMQLLPALCRASEDDLAGMQGDILTYVAGTMRLAHNQPEVAACAGP